MKKKWCLLVNWNRRNLGLSCWGLLLSFYDPLISRTHSSSPPIVTTTTLNLTRPDVWSFVRWLTVVSHGGGDNEVGGRSVLLHDGMCDLHGWVLWRTVFHTSPHLVLPCQMVAGLTTLMLVLGLLVWNYTSCHVVSQGWRWIAALSDVLGLEMNSCLPTIQQCFSLIMSFYSNKRTLYIASAISHLFRRRD